MKAVFGVRDAKRRVISEICKRLAGKWKNMSNTRPGNKKVECPGVCAIFFFYAAFEGVTRFLGQFHSPRPIRAHREK